MNNPHTHNAQICNRNVHMLAHFSDKMGHFGILSDVLWDLWDGFIGSWRQYWVCSSHLQPESHMDGGPYTFLRRRAIGEYTSS